MIPFLLLLFSQVTPVDLPQMNFYWRDLSDAVRINVASEFGNDMYVAATLALIKIEQPHSVPDNNGSGLHAWRERYPWGWNRYWSISGVRPDGFFLAREGMSGLYKPYLHFAYFRHNFAVTLSIVRNRDIIDGKLYNKRWVSRMGRNRAFDKYRDYYYEALGGGN